MERAERFRWYQAQFLGLILTLGWGMNVTAFGQAGPDPRAARAGTPVATSACRHWRQPRLPWRRLCPCSDP